MFKAIVYVCLVAAVVLVAVKANDEDDQKELLCNKLTSCKDCISGPSDNPNATVNNSTDFSLECYWCSKADNRSLRCRHFDFDVALPISGVDCPQAKYNVGTCELDALTIIILIAVACLLLVIVVTTVCCCCCCWCSRRRKKSQMIQQERYDTEKDAIRERSADRRAERKSRNEDIRRKYGLYRDEPSSTGGTYNRLE